MFTLVKHIGKAVEVDAWFWWCGLFICGGNDGPNRGFEKFTMRPRLTKGRQS